MSESNGNKGKNGQTNNKALRVRFLELATDIQLLTRHESNQVSWNPNLEVFLTTGKDLEGNDHWFGVKMQLGEDEHRTQSCLTFMFFNSVVSDQWQYYETGPEAAKELIRLCNIAARWVRELKAKLALAQQEEQEVVS